jgi:hypothetical protein
MSRATVLDLEETKRDEELDPLSEIRKKVKKLREVQEYRPPVDNYGSEEESEEAEP